MDYNKETLYKQCEVCGEVFATKRTNKLYCSKECAQKKHNKSARERAREKAAQPSKKMCIVCNKMFTASPAQRTTCSLNCRVVRRNYMVAKNRATKNVEEITPKTRKKTVNLVEAAKLAREAGLTYGQWQAKQYLEER